MARRGRRCEPVTVPNVANLIPHLEAERGAPRSPACGGRVEHAVPQLRGERGEPHDMNVGNLMHKRGERGSPYLSIELSKDLTSRRGVGVRTSVGLVGSPPAPSVARPGSTRPTTRWLRDRGDDVSRWPLKAQSWASSTGGASESAPHCGTIAAQRLESPHVATLFGGAGDSISPGTPLT